jgi:AcrR family transcriptional regulator
MSSGSGPGRARNPRGEGERLRSEIVCAAREILVEDGYEAAITLRGVARRVGIAAPSIYPHFAGPAAIVQAVVVEAFGELNAFIEAAVRDLVDPRARLLAGCRAYITFGIESPNIYKLLFDRNRELGGRSPQDRAPTEDDLWHGPFSQLVVAVDACIRAGISTATSSPATALDIWVGMHGLVMLRGNRYDMPWPPRDAMEPPFISALARLTT